VITLTGVVGGTSLIENLSFIENAGLDLKVIVLCSGDDTDDLVARARTCGIFGRTASVPDDIVTAFVEAFDYAGPALVEIRTPQPIPRLPRRVGTS
jgi:thiamine pyrophosphate-dependent acetolactate synthase large subunit-like protein